MSQAFRLPPHTTESNKGYVNTYRPVKDVKELQKRIETLRYFLRNPCRFPACLATGGGT
jgi:hypothetical protein